MPSKPSGKLFHRRVNVGGYHLSGCQLEKIFVLDWEPGRRLKLNVHTRVAPHFQVVKVDRNTPSGTALVADYKTTAPGRDTWVIELKNVAGIKPAFYTATAGIFWRPLPGPGRPYIQQGSISITFNLTARDANCTPGGLKLLVLRNGAPLQDRPGRPLRVLRLLRLRETVIKMQQQGDWYQVRTGHGEIGWAEKSTFHRQVGGSIPMPTRRRHRR